MLALTDHSMFNSPITGALASADEDMREWMIVAYSPVRGTRTEKKISDWGFVRCPPAIATQAYKEGRGASLSVLMTANTYDLCFVTGKDLGNAIYGQWIKHIMTGEQRSRMFGGVSSANEERAGDAIEVCLAMLFFATLYPHEFKMRGIRMRTTLELNIPCDLLQRPQDSFRQLGLRGAV